MYTYTTSTVQCWRCHDSCTLILQEQACIISVNKPLFALGSTRGPSYTHTSSSGAIEQLTPNNIVKIKKLSSLRQTHTAEQRQESFIVIHQRTE